jgi:peptidoglycan/LPS O-acetylase OafA/YrhL
MSSSGSLVQSQPLDSRRLDIQGLRAVAVLMVITFHAGLPIPGGFVGVDVFFVISGFVITTVLQRKRVRDGHVAFGAFYWLRFKRLMPALSLVTTVTMILSILILSPFGPQQTAAGTAIGAMFGVSNVVIASTTGGYFDAQAETNPFLQMWSLSVEEQFYVVFPAVLALGWTFSLRWRRFSLMPYFAVGTLALASVSFLVCGSFGMFGEGNQFITGFYSPFTRAWEFAVGALLALLLNDKFVLSALFRTLAGAVGAGMVIGSVLMITGETPFPGKWTLLPVVGTVLLLAAGSGGGSLVAQLLSIRPLVKIGDWSYSIYLWHWPLIVFAILLWPLEDLAPLLACTLAIPLAAISYRWLERPLRQHQFRSRSRALAFSSMIIAIPTMVATATWIQAADFWQPRYQSGQMVAANSGTIGIEATFDILKSRYFPCAFNQVDDQAQFSFGVRRCLQSAAHSDIGVVILGDSHAEHLFVGLAEVLPKTNVAYVYLDAWPTRASMNSSETFRQVSETPSIKVVVLSSYWKTQALNDKLDRDIQLLLHSGKRVLVTDDLPDYPFDAFACKYKNGLFGQPLCSRPAEEFWQEHETSLAPVREAVAHNPGAELVETARYFCGDMECSMAFHGEVLYADSHHLNVAGSRFLVSRLRQDHKYLFDEPGWDDDLPSGG